MLRNNYYPNIQHGAVQFAVVCVVATVEAFTDI